MEEKSYYKLCGGLFFNVILTCRRSRTGARETMLYGGDGLTDPNMLGGLIEVFYPDYEQPSTRSFSTNTSRYKQSYISKGAYLPFDDKNVISDFDQVVKNDYSKALHRMIDYCENYMVRARKGMKTNAATRILLDVIAADESIALDQKFYVMPDGSCLTKKELSSVTHLYWQPFLLGVWHFIVVNRPQNDIGKNNKAGELLDRYIMQEENTTIYHFGYRINVEDYLCDKELDDNSKGIEKSFTTYDYSEYLNKTKNKYQEIKTLLYNDSPRKFYDFYVCNDIARKSFSYRGPLEASVMKLTHQFSKRIILTGTGGMGKSMMMRHLLLDAIEEYETTRIVPVFIPLKNYSDNIQTLFDYVYECINKTCDIKEEQFKHSLIYGSISLLLDGLDEIKIELLPSFQQSLEEFIDKYPNIIIIISSRPFQDFVSFSGFSVMELMPFTKKQALELIEKLEFRPDEPDFKEKFKHELEHKLFDTHQEFCTNPLLLTIMLMTFEQFAEIPSKMHIFYREAYLALAQKHDASKGGFKRTLKSGLSVERFSDYLAEFCMRTYHDEKFEFTYEEFNKYFSSLKENNRYEGENVISHNFLYDLRSNMCLLYYESGKYHFTHRSFQEYFCALFFSKQKDKTLGAIGNFFETRKSRTLGDRTFNMLYDMIPDHVEEYIFLPFLENKIEKYKLNGGYFAFLQDNYKDITYTTGNVNRIYINEPDSFLMNFILDNILPHEKCKEIELPFYSEFVLDTFTLIRLPDGDTTYVDTLELDSYLHDRAEILEDETGYLLSANIEDVYNNADYFDDFINAIKSDEYALKLQYNTLIKYYEDLKKKMVPLSDSFFDIF